MPNTPQLAVQYIMKPVGAKHTDLELSFVHDLQLLSTESSSTDGPGCATPFVGVSQSSYACQ